MPNKKQIPMSGLNLIQRQQLQRMEEISKHRDAAAQTAMLICCIILNRKHKFGKERIRALADEVTAELKEFYADPETGCYNIQRTMEQLGFDGEIEEIMRVLLVKDGLGNKLRKAGR